MEGGTSMNDTLTQAEEHGNEFARALLMKGLTSVEVRMLARILWMSRRNSLHDHTVVPGRVVSSTEVREMARQVGCPHTAFRAGAIAVAEEFHDL
jgi:hypothetical protein